jgi:hypothetical protein
MARVIPSFLSDGVDSINYSGGAFNSVRMCLGEVQEIVWPDDPRSVSKKFVEYRVWTTLFENSTFVTRMIEAVSGSDIFGSGTSDTFNYTMRPSGSAGTTDGNKKLGRGLGSKVLMICILGMTPNYVIISGLRDSNSPIDDKSTGHHLDFNFNGIECNINNDGELTLTYSGATKADGTLQDDVDTDAVGTTLTITKDGSLSIVDNSSNESIVIDRPNGNINVAASSGVTIKAQQIALGPQPNSPAVIGTQLVSVLQQLCLAISSISVVTAGAPSSPPVNAAQFVEISSTLNTILSQIVTLQ